MTAVGGGAITAGVGVGVGVTVAVSIGSGVASAIAVAAVIEFGILDDLLVNVGDDLFAAFCEHI